MKKTLRELREDRCLKVYEVANAIGAFVPSTMSDYEIGKHKVPEVNRKRLARFYNLQIDQIEWDVEYIPKCKRRKQTSKESTKVLAETKNDPEKLIKVEETRQMILPKLIPTEAPESADLELNELIYEAAIDLLDPVCKEMLSLPTRRAKLTRLADLDNCFCQFNLDTKNMKERLNGEKEKRPYGRN